MNNRKDYYPELEPYETGMLAVSNLHTIYWEKCGNPNGKPALFVHGGPGGGTDENCRRFFDPDKYNIILFHQRGCGKSTPHAELEENNTQELIKDMEKLREHFNIEKWLVFGGSWGSTLSLAYAQEHPERVMQLVLRGIFMCRRSELEWFYQEGASKIFPDVFEPYRDFIPENERGDMMAAYYRRLTDSDENIRGKAARLWTNWEKSTSQLIPKNDLKKKSEDDHFALAFARIECHYFNNNAFLEENQLLKNIERIRHIPCVIVQGRYDVVCPPISAWELHKAWPQSELQFIADAGHSMVEPGIRDALIRATDRFSNDA